MFWNNAAKAKVWNKLMWWRDYSKNYKAIVSRWKHPMMVRVDTFSVLISLPKAKQIKGGVGGGETRQALKPNIII